MQARAASSNADFRNWSRMRLAACQTASIAGVSALLIKMGAALLE